MFAGRGGLAGPAAGRRQAECEPTGGRTRIIRFSSPDLFVEGMGTRAYPSGSSPNWTVPSELDKSALSMKIHRPKRPRDNVEKIEIAA